MKLKWPDEKIKIPVTKDKSKKPKREAAFINNRNVCPLCFGTNLNVISANITPDCTEGEIRFTAVCKECEIKIYYFKKIGEI